MSDGTRIDWADASWNPFGWGCYGPGGNAENPRRCSYCFGARLAKRKMNACQQCNDFVPHWHPEKLDQPLHWKKPRRVFCGSMADPFGDWVMPEQLDAVLEVIAATPQHTYYMLTKQPQNIMAKLYDVTAAWPCRELGGGDYLENLWIGASVDTEARAESSWQPMTDVAFLWHTFASVEPMLGAVNPGSLNWAEWVIVGSMTGPGSAGKQPNPDMVRFFIRETVHNGQPIFVKDSLSHISTRQEWPQ
jgi:protein gp37